MNTHSKIGNNVNVHPDATTHWAFGDGVSVLGTYTLGEDERGLLFRAVPDNLISLVNRGDLDPEALMQAVPAYAPTMLLRITSPEAVDKMVESLIRLKLEMSGMDEEAVDLAIEMYDELSGVFLALATDIAAEKVPEYALPDRGTVISGTIDTKMEIADFSEKTTAAIDSVTELFNRTVEKAPSLDVPITIEQAGNLNDVSYALVDFLPPRFDQTGPHAAAEIVGHEMTLSPEEVHLNADHPEIFTGFDVAGYAAVWISPLRGERWHDYTTRVFGLNDHHNANAWSYIIGGTIAQTDGNTPRDAARRIAAFLVKATGENMVVPA